MSNANLPDMKNGSASCPISAACRLRIIGLTSPEAERTAPSKIALNCLSAAAMLSTTATRNRSATFKPSAVPNACKRLSAPRFTNDGSPRMMSDVLTMSARSCGVAVRLNAGTSDLVRTFRGGWAPPAFSTNRRAGRINSWMMSASVSSKLANPGMLLRSHLRIADTARLTNPISGLVCAISASTSSAATRMSD